MDGFRRSVIYDLALAAIVRRRMCVFGWVVAGDVNGRLSSLVDVGGAAMIGYLYWSVGALGETVS